MLARREAIRSALLQATFLSSSMVLASVLPNYARAQVACFGTETGSCVIGPNGLVIAVGNGPNGTGDAAGFPGGNVIVQAPAPSDPPMSAWVNGGNGGNGSDASLDSSASAGGNGGAAGTIRITNLGAVTTSGSTGYSAVAASASGGTGGSGGSADRIHSGADGGDGGSGGFITITNSGALVVAGSSAGGIVGWAAGGVGGVGGEGDWPKDAGTSGNGGTGGSVTVDNQGAITTLADFSVGVFVVTNGGVGGNGAGFKNSGADGSYAGNGGNAGGAAALAAGTIPYDKPLLPDEASANVQNSAAITTSGTNSSGIWVSGAGGNGGNVGYTSTATGGTGGNGGTAYASDSGNIIVSGDGAIGIGVTTTGGIGGQGGYHSGNGGAGGAGGNGGLTTIGISAPLISTSGNNAFGILGSADGGAGGAAGFGDGYSNSGGDGGNAGSTFIVQTGSVTTSGLASDAIHATAAGGVAPDEIFTVAAGGGTGGNGGLVYVDANGTITTTGDSSSGLYLDASGGAGGYGKNGGNGGNGGTATAISFGTITISGGQSTGITVRTRGGDGGGSGVDESDDRGAGGAGGNGGTASVTSNGVITGSGSDEIGILIDTRGGTVGVESSLITPNNGGSAGTATLKSYGAITLKSTVQGTGISIIADGGSGCASNSTLCGPSGGGNGNTATAFIYGSVTTAGSNLSGAVSIAARGGDGGSGSLYSLSDPVGSGGDGGAINITVSNLTPAAGNQFISTAGGGSPAISLDASGGIGGTGALEDGGKDMGSGGAGGDAGNVTVTITDVHTEITTQGDDSPGIIVSAMGGNGGGGDYKSGFEGPTGSNGGAGGNAGIITISSGAAIATTGPYSSGIVAISGGGGGGDAGDNGTGGQGGTGAVGTNAISVTNSGTITTGGINSYGIFLSSVGGSGSEALGNAGGAGNAAPSGNVHLLNGGSISTTGDNAFGVLAQSIGGGPTLLSPQDAANAASSGNVELLNPGSISTTGVNAIGILAQSIGGGGGLGSAATAGSGALGNSSSGSNAQVGGTVTIDLGSAGAVITKGDGASAIVAQSIGGGGGYTGPLDTADASYPTYLSQTNDSAMTVGANTEGGDVSVTSTGPATITTTGANAHGIIAQSLSGGGGLVGNAQGILIIPPSTYGLSRGASTSSNEFSPGSVTVDFTGILETTGAGSVAIFAQSGTQDSSGAIDRTLPMTTSGDISVTIGANSTVIGGSGVYAVRLDGGATNTITIGNGAKLSSQSNEAIWSGWGNNTLINNGTITGDVAIYGTASFENGVTGEYISAGDGNVTIGGTGPGGDFGTGKLSNDGIVNVAGVGTIGTLVVVGTYAQSATGTYLADVDGSNGGSSDNIAASYIGETVAGTVKVNVMNSIGPSDQFMIISQSGAGSNSIVTATAGLSVVSAQNSGVVSSWNMIRSYDTLYISPNLTFAPFGLSLGDNERAYADHLQKTWDAGGSAKLDRVYAELFNLPNQTAYQKALASATPTVLATGSLGQTLVARDRLNAVQSCPEFDEAGGTGTLLVQRDCAWGRVGGGRTDFTPSNGSGYTINQMTYATGFQKEFAPDWFVGMSASYMADTYSNTSGLSSSTGQGVDVTAVLKREMGQWLVSGALDLGYGWYDAQRWTAVGSNFYQSDSSYNVFTAAARFKADYEIPFQNWYLKPFGQLDLLYASTPGYDEGGHGSLYDLSVAGSDNFSVAIGPHLEVGGRVNFTDGSVLRPYAQAGVTWFSNSDWQVSAALQGAQQTTGTFKTAVDAPNLLADLTLGLQWSLPHGIDLRVNYEANLGDNFTSQTGMARLSVNF